MASVVDIKAVSYDVCGVVQMVSLGYKAKVTFNPSYCFPIMPCNGVCQNGCMLSLLLISRTLSSFFSSFWIFEKGDRVACYVIAVATSIDRS